MTWRRRRHHWRAVGAGLAGIVASVSWVGDQAQAAPIRPPDVSDGLLEGNGFETAIADLELAEAAVRWARAEIALNENLVVQLGSGIAQIHESMPRLEQSIERLGIKVDEARDDLADLAVLKYVIKGTDAELEAFTTDPSDLSASGRRSLVVETATSGHRATLRNARIRYEDSVSALATARSGIEGLEQRRRTAEVDLSTAKAVLAEATASIPVLEATISEERRGTRFAGSDLSFIAVEAYRMAAIAANDASAGCGVQWTTLAGIGRVESRHGTYAGSVLTESGDVVGPIIGIALDGSRETAVVPDTDAGLLDGDFTFDRAVGPMQFIPGTWRAFGVDGNGDGVVDPQNIYDSASAAGAYLCKGGPVVDPASLRGAILTYNNSEAYVDAVLVHAARYANLGIDQ